METRILSRNQGFGSQRGLTMVELVIAIAISSIIIISSLALLTYMMRVAVDNRHKTLASMEVQYAGFFISEDVVQAQKITMGDLTSGFPLKVEWLDTQADKKYTVIYTLKGPENGLYKLERESLVEEQSEGTTLVGQDIVGQDIGDLDKDGNTTEWLTKADRYTAPQEDPDVGKVSSLIVKVTANVDGRVATNEYEIHPRAFSRWYPET